MRRQMRAPKGAVETVVFTLIVGGFLLGLVTGFGAGLAVGLPLTAFVLALTLLEDSDANAEAQRRIADSEKAKRP